MTLRFGVFDHIELGKIVGSARGKSARGGHGLQLLYDQVGCTAGEDFEVRPKVVLYAAYVVAYPGNKSCISGMTHNGG